MAWLAAQGFLVVVQDTRGRWSSDGSFCPFRDSLRERVESITSSGRWAPSRCSSRPRTAAGARGAAEPITGLSCLARGTRNGLAWA